MANDIGQPETIRIDTTAMSKQEVADLLSTMFRVRADLEDKGLKLVIKRRKPYQRRKTV